MSQNKLPTHGLLEVRLWLLLIITNVVPPCAWIISLHVLIGSEITLLNFNSEMLQTLLHPHRVHFSLLLWTSVKGMCFCHSVQPLNFETKKSYTLKVEAANIRFDPNSGAPFKDTATVKIAVEDSDEPPVFSKPTFVLQVDENAPINTVVGTVTARDPDVTGSLVR